ncbi:ROK family transcriptional regulator [Actinokineospora spheciospongiae]|uniref:ROK family transcriptional regulator n=1 Tax=Actinokineospora spheciospongiae TaxID=909613 RepID=UPI00054E5A0E
MEAVLSRNATAAGVLAVIRRAGPLSRAAIGERTGLSLPTVSRSVSALIGVGLVREHPELVPVGSIGRPRVPLHLDDGVFAVGGVHIGVSTTTYGLADLRGAIIASQELPTPSGDAEDALAHIAGKLRAFLRRFPRRVVLGVGLASGGQVDTERGLLDHERLGWRSVPAAEALRRATGLPVLLEGHVAAMASAELVFGRGASAPSLLYFYAREVVGIALVVEGRLHRGPWGGSTIAHLPVGGSAECPCGALGCLEAEVCDRTVAERAAAAGVVDEADIRLVRAAAAGGDSRAVGLLTDRAHTIGRAAAILRDVLNPHAVVLGGQAVTEDPDRLPDLLRSFRDTTTLPGPADLVSVTPFGPAVQAVAACTGLLTRVFENPFDFVRPTRKAPTP